MNIAREDHFLRPELTRLVIQYLERGGSLNLHGPTGMGKTRLLEDIAGAGLEGARVVLVSFRGYSANYGGFCRAIAAAGGLSGETPGSMSAVVDELTRAGAPVFLLIDDLHYLAENPEIDPRFDLLFVEALNNIKNTPGVSLLTASLKPMGALTIFIKKKPTTSVLDLRPIEAASFTTREIRAELERRFPRNILDIPGIVRLSNHLRARENPYGLIEYYEPKILSKDGPGLDDEMLEIWRGEIKKAYRN